MVHFLVCLQALVTPMLNVKPPASDRIAVSQGRASTGFGRLSQNKRPSSGGGRSNGPGWRAHETLGWALWLDEDAEQGQE